MVQVCPHCFRGEFTKHGFSPEGKQRLLCKCCGRRIIEESLLEVEDPEIIQENVKLQKSKQKFQDINRIERKSFREYARLDNALIEYDQALIKVLQENSFHDVPRHRFKPGGAVGCIHITDTHFNELVTDVINNRYDFTVASQRIKKLVDQSIKYFSVHNIKNVLVALTGDLLNSDRRLDELLNQATNRSQATFVSVDILQQALRELAAHYGVAVACVSGNESRVKQEYGSTDLMSTDNYDFMIFNMLKYLFRGPVVDFITGDPFELVVTLAGQNVLLTHGRNLPTAKGLESALQQVKGKWAAHGVLIDFILHGHFHSARIGDFYSRGSSLVGPNAYGEKELQLEGRASQNIHIFYENGERDSIKVDLQNVEGVEGYSIDETLAAYNVKSAEKAREKKVIFEVRV